MLRMIGTAFALQFALCAPVWACEGQAGKVIFEDTFADDSGGWDILPHTEIKAPEFLLTPDSKQHAAVSLNSAFRAREGDYCMEFYLPKSIAPDDPVYVGMLFWAKGGYANSMKYFRIGSDGELSFWNLIAGAWQRNFTLADVPAFKSDPAAVNTLRVIAKDGKLTLILNDSPIKVIRTQVPEDTLQFGIQGEVLKGIGNVPPIRVKSFRVTTGE